MTVIVDIADSKVAADPMAVVATYSLGSCVAVSVYDPVARVGGMLHYQLPTSTLDPQRAQLNPNMFADTGLECLLSALVARGAVLSRMKVKLAGAAQILAGQDSFQIGRRNHAAIRKILWQRGLFIEGEDVGGSSPRNVYLRIADGAVASESRDHKIAL